MADLSMLEAFSLSAGWQNRPVCQIEKLALSAGSCLVLAGPNGAGKSTIVKTLARQIEPVAGTVSLNGVNLKQWEVGPFAQKVAYVPQSVEIYRQLTVEEWVSLGRNPHQPWWSWKSSQADAEIIESAMAQTGTSDLRNKFMDTLSGGQRQRATVAMALAQEPQFLLLDEPSAHLDFRHQLELVELLIDLRKKGMALLIVLHDLNLIARLATEVVLLKQAGDGIGKVAFAGPPEQVLQADILREVYDVQVSICKDEATGFTSYLPTRVWK